MSSMLRALPIHVIYNKLGPPNVQRAGNADIWTIPEGPVGVWTGIDHLFFLGRRGKMPELFSSGTPNGRNTRVILRHSPALLEGIAAIVPHSLPPTPNGCHFD